MNIQERATAGIETATNLGASFREVDRKLARAAYRATLGNAAARGLRVYHEAMAAEASDAGGVGSVERAQELRAMRQKAGAQMMRRAVECRELAEAALAAAQDMEQTVAELLKERAGV